VKPELKFQVQDLAPSIYIFGPSSGSKIIWSIESWKALCYLYTCIITPAWMRCRETIYLMDSGTCAKSLRNPDWHTNELGCRKNFIQGGTIVNFSRRWPNAFFPQGPTVVKLFYQPETKRKTFFEIQFPKGLRPHCTPSDAQANEDKYVHIWQTTFIPQSVSLLAPQLGLCNQNSISGSGFVSTMQGPSLRGDGGDMSPQHLDRGDIISFVPPTFCDKK